MKTGMGGSRGFQSCWHSNRMLGRAPPLTGSPYTFLRLSFSFLVFYVQCPKTRVAAVKQGMALSESKRSKISGDAASRAWQRACVCFSKVKVYTHTRGMVKMQILTLQGWWSLRAHPTQGSTGKAGSISWLYTSGHRWLSLQNSLSELLSNPATKNMYLGLASSLWFMKIYVLPALSQFLHVFMHACMYVEYICVCICASVCIVNV